MAFDLLLVGSTLNNFYLYVICHDAGLKEVRLDVRIVFYRVDAILNAKRIGNLSFTGDFKIIIPFNINRLRDGKSVEVRGNVDNDTSV